MELTLHNPGEISPRGEVFVGVFRSVAAIPTRLQHG